MLPLGRRDPGAALRAAPMVSRPGRDVKRTLQVSGARSGKNVGTAPCFRKMALQNPLLLSKSSKDSVCHPALRLLLCFADERFTGD